jgi:hypothetical protein
MASASRTEPASEVGSEGADLDDGSTGGAAGSATPGAGVRVSWDAIWRPAGIFLGSRVATLFAAAVAADLHPTHGLGGILTRTWDTGWYLLVAEIGYPASVPEQAGTAVQSTIGFFPLYPLAIRALHNLGLPYPAAGLVISGIAGVIAAVLLWLLVRHLSGAAIADRAVALFCFFPGALVLSLAYSEALMLALSIGCLYALVRDRWITAGVLAGLATAVRPNAIALVAACAWAAGAAVWRRRDWRSLLAPALSPIGLIAFFVYLGRRTGETDAYMRTQREGWEQTLEPGSAIDTVRKFLQDPFADTNITVTFFGLLFLAVTLVLLVRSRPPGVLLIYAVVVMGLALTNEKMSARPRFLVTAFPLVTVLAEGMSQTAFSVLLASSAILLGAFTILSTTTLLATL